MSELPILLVIWHSRTGTAAAAAQLIIEACAEFRVRPRCLSAVDATSDDLRLCDAVIFACPENLGSMSGIMKDFFDRSYYDLLDHVAGKAYATVIAAGSDGTGALRQIERIATGLRLKKVAEALTIMTKAQTPAAITATKQLTPEQVESLTQLGKTLAAGLEVGIY